MDPITDKANWSAAKAHYLRHGHTEQQWSALTDQERVGWLNEYLDWKDRQPKSAQQLRAELRKARIDIEILKKKLAAANAKIAQFEASRELAALLLAAGEPTCP